MKPGFKPQPQQNAENLPSVAGELLVHLRYEAQVMDCWDEPLVGAEVTIKDVETGRVYRATTDEKGVFRFLSVRPGRYMISITPRIVGEGCIFPMNITAVFTEFEGVPTH